MPHHQHRQSRTSKQQISDTGTSKSPSSLAVSDINEAQISSNPEMLLQLQGVIGNQAIQRLLDQQQSIPSIQRQEGHNEGCGCPICAGQLQRMDEHEEDIQAKRIVQRADEHEEDIQAKRIVQRDDEEEPKPSISQRLDQLSKKNLKKKLDTIVAEYGAITLADIKKVIEDASQGQRDKVWKNEKLMAKLKAKMSENDYLTMLPALRMFKKGKTAEDKKSHTRADKADKYIRKYLGDYAGEAVKRGASVEGQVAVVDGDDWAKAYDNEFGNDGEEDITNAFVDDAGLIWIHKNRGNAGTIIHEGVHKYSTGDFLTAVGFNFNEGITEYFTRLICDKLKYKRGNYESNYKFSKKFVEYLGEEKVAAAYFDGAVDELKKAFADKEKDWDTLVGHVKDKKWSDAKGMLS